MKQSTSRKITRVLTKFLTYKGEQRVILSSDPDTVLTEILGQEYIGWEHTMKRKSKKQGGDSNVKHISRYVLMGHPATRPEMMALVKQTYVLL